MNSPLASIAWKEWREHRWKLASLVAIAAGIQLWSLWPGEGLREGRYLLPLMLTYMGVVPLASVFVATGAAAGERSHGTLSMLQRQPYPLSAYATFKLLFAIAVVGLSMTAAVGASAAAASFVGWWGGPDAELGLRTLSKGVGPIISTGHWTTDIVMSSLLVSTSLVVWVAALGVNSESEVRAAAISLGVIAGIWGAIALAASLAGNQDSAHASSLNLRPLSAMLPVGVVGLQGAGLSPLSVLTPFLIAHVPLALWYVARYGRVEGGGDRSPSLVERAASGPSWLGAPQPSPLRSLLWKQARQNQPLVGAGFAAAIVLLVLTVTLQHYNDDHSQYTLRAFSPMYIGSAAATWFTVFGCFVAFVAGLGVGANDLTPSLETFWRSRPIHPSTWYAAALVSGLGLVFVAFGLPAVTGLAFVAGSQSEAFGLLAGPIAVILLGFAAATLAGVVIRHTVYASLIAIGLFITSYMTVVARIEAEALACLAWIAIGVAMLLLAWLAVQKNWSLTP